MKLLWCSLSKCCFPLYETSVVLLVKMLFPLYESSVVLLVKMLFPIVRSFCGVPCQNVFSLVRNLCCSFSKCYFRNPLINFCLFYISFLRPDYRNRNSDSLRTGPYGDRISVEKRFSVLVKTGPKPIQPPRQLIQVFPGNKTVRACC